MKMKIFTFTLVLLMTPCVSANHGKQVSQGCNAFACDIYAQLKSEQGNLFFSPYSIYTALAMTYAGAQGITKEEMDNVFHIALPQDEFHSAYSALIDSLNDDKTDRPFELAVANKLFVQQGYKLSFAFESIVKSNYGAAFDLVDFVNNPGGASSAINLWVAAKTNDKINDIVAPDIFNEFTRLVLANAIYFKGKWVTQFGKDSTKKRDFYMDNQNKTEVDMMAQTGHFNYMENKDLKMLELPYKGDGLSMFVLLPHEIEGIKNIEAVLTQENVQHWLSHMKSQEVIVRLPKFKMETSYRLKDNLAAMGMPSAFSKRANFRGIGAFENGFEENNLKIDKVIHKAFIETDEEGTEAAAATVVTMMIDCAGEFEPQPKIFIADHPFMFMIQDKKTGLILFMGRFENPDK